MRRRLGQLSVVVTSWNTIGLLRACLASLEEAVAAGAQLVVVDDASADGSAEMVRREFPQAELLALEENQGYSLATNLGALRCRGEWLLLLNADTEVRPGALALMLDFLQANPAHGAVAPRLVSPRGETLRSCMALPRWSTALFFATPLERWAPESAELERYFMRDFDHLEERDVPQPPAAALMLPLSLWRDLGGFDPVFGLFFGDVDLAARLRRRRRPMHYLPEAEVLHHVGASTFQLPDFAARWHRDRLAYYRKQHGRLAGVWVKTCTSFAWAAHLSGRRLWRRGPERAAPLLPLWRSFGAFLLS